MSTGTATPSAEARLVSHLTRHGVEIPRTRIVALTGDASDRRYFRVTLPDGQSRVAAVHVGAIDSATMPFVAVSRLFAEMPVPVPRVLEASDDLGVLLLDDLGDTTLFAYLPSATAAERTALYRQAIDLIGVIQERGAALAASGCVAYGLAFDVEKLTFELQFFLRHFVEGHRGAALSPAARTAFGEAFADIVEELAAEPRVLCHRDYHSRNLMLASGRLVVIDFQDARMGPDTYDLASLVRDSYVDLTEAEEASHVAYFRERRAQRPGAAPESADDFQRRFELMSLQRGLKALGTFGFQASVKGNSGYLEAVPRTLARVGRTLRGTPRFGRLHTLLASAITELR
jgi:aminoglycoside/choline kinase family phosphotransferase